LDIPSADSWLKCSRFSILKDGKPVARGAEDVFATPDAVASVGPIPLAGYAAGAYVVTLDVTDGVTVDATRADVEQMLTTLLIAGRDLLPVGGSLVLRTGAGEEGAAVLTVTAQGYGVVTDANTSALAAVVRQCNGTLTTGPAARAFEFKISF